MCRSTSRSDRWRFALSAALCLLLAATGCSAAGASPASCEGYAVAPADDGAKEDLRWADYLRDHLWRRAEGGKRLVPDEPAADATWFALTVGVDTLMEEDFRVERSRRGVRLTARDGRTMLWLQYQLMKSLAEEDSRIEASDLPPSQVGLRDTAGRFAYAYRGLYAPAAMDPDHGGILSVDNVENDWGLWGHQLDRVLAGGPKEVMATAGGRLEEAQFCLSSEETFRRIEAFVVDRFGEGDGAAARFVIAPADNAAVCGCAACSAAGNTARSATPAAAGLVARLARRFPHHAFFLLGYRSTQEPPAVELPAGAGAIVSAMELPFAKGAPDTPAGKRFARHLEGWKRVAGTVYVWDYVQNFDDYLTPFPVLEQMAERLRFYRDRGVDGVFLNGSGYDYVPFDDMRCWVLASLMRDPDRPVEELVRRFFADKYPRSGELLADYCLGIERRAAASDRELSLYGGIREAEAAWLDAGEFVRFYEELERTLPATKEMERRRLHELLTALSYTRLELARNHADGAWGFAERTGGRRSAIPAVERWLTALEEHAAFAGMQYVDEVHLPVDAYVAAWRERILRAPESSPLPSGSGWRIVSVPDEGYADPAVLSDGVPGLGVGYHYGWLISSVDLEAELPGSAVGAARRFSMSFLDCPRHRLHAPQRVEIYKDGVLYRTFVPEADAARRVFTAAGDVDLSGAGRVTVRAVRDQAGRSKLAADEIYLIP